MTLLAPGRHDVVEQLAALRELEHAGWPEPDLWICAVRRRDGRRVVFGRPGSPEVPIHLAVAASCAVPGYFAPVRIGGRSYIDGGVHSPTNAAVLRGAGLDVVIVISPMSGPAGWRPDIHAAGRRHAARLLAREVKALEAEGVRTVVFAPGADEQEVMGNDMLSRERLNEVIQQAFLAAGAHAARARGGRADPAGRRPLGGPDRQAEPSGTDPAIGTRTTGQPYCSRCSMPAICDMARAAPSAPSARSSSGSSSQSAGSPPSARKA